MVPNKAEELEALQRLVPEVVQAEVMSFPGSFCAKVYSVLMCNDV